MFTENDDVINAVHSAIRIAQTTTLTPHDHKLVIAYLAANLIYDNGQRPGVVQYMEIDEYLKRQCIDGQEIIQILKHKTGKQRGPAKLVVSNPMIINLLQMYYTIIRQPQKAISEQIEKRFFLLPSGSEFKKVYELKSAIALEFDITPPTPTSYCKMIASDASEHLSSKDVGNLQIHMSHSKQTCERYYQKQTFTAALKSHDSIEMLAQHRKRFTQKEDKNILIEWPVATDTKTPPLSLCRMIGTKYKIVKDAQQIQDRWKYLYKKHMA